MTRNKKNKPVNLNKVVKNAKGVNLNQKSVNQALKLVEKVNAIREAKRKAVYDKPYREFQRDTPTTIRDIKTMSKTEFMELNDVYFNINSIQSQSQLDSRIKSLRRMSTKKYYNELNKRYKQNFLDSIDTVYGGKVDEKMLNEYKRMVKRLSADEVANMRYTSELSDLEQRYINTSYQDQQTIEDYFDEDLAQIRQAYNIKQEQANEKRREFYRRQAKKIQ